jgi:hypothetical protein
MAGATLVGSSGFSLPVFSFAESDIFESSLVYESDFRLSI